MIDAGWWLNPLLAAATVIGVIFIFFQYQYTYWSRKNVPHLDPAFPFGNAGSLNRTQSLGELARAVYDAGQGMPVMGMWIFYRPILIIRDPAILRTVLIKEFSSFHDRGLPQNEKFDPLTGHLFFLKGLKWRNLRIKLTPTFTSGKMKMMFPTLVACGEGLREALKEPATRGESVEVKDILSCFTTDVIASCAFGLQINAFQNPNSEFRKTSQFLFKPNKVQAIKNSLIFTFPKIQEFLRLTIVPKNVTKFFIAAVEDTIRQREEHNIQRNDFMQLLIELKNKGKIEDSDVYKHEEEREEVGEDYDPSFTTVQAAAQAFVFFVAGFETSSTAMMFCLYELAKNHDIQDKLRQEMDRVFGEHGGKLTYEGLQEMEYLDRVVSETLRKYPPAPLLARECTKPCWIPEANLIVEKGTRILVPVLGIHHNPEYYPQPEKFDPDRFSPEQRAARNPMTYMPFGEGPRMCIGMRFGQMQTKAGLAIFLSNYKVDLSKETPTSIEFDPKVNLTAIKSKMHLKVLNR